MLDLTFGEQVKIILSRKGMTIKELAETIEERTGKKMSRQNLTQRLGRDNFQEQDMRMIADILESSFQLNILDSEEISERAIRKSREPKKIEPKKIEQEQPSIPERDITIGELVEIHEELDTLIQEETGNLPPLEAPVEELLEEMAAIEAEEQGRMQAQNDTEAEEKKSQGWMSYLQRRRKKTSEIDEAPAEALEESASEVYESQEYEPQEYVTEEYVTEEYEEDTVAGDTNPYTGKEYKTNSVRIHPTRIGYVQVYDREEHRWTDMTEWAFLGYQERKKALLGKDYEPPIYLD